MSNKKLLAVDLFSGAGGLSLGFLQTGQVEIAAAVENNESAQRTYRRNHELYKRDSFHKIKYFNDIRELDYKEQILNDFQKIDLVFGGPPCQGFSNANRQKTELISTNNQLVKEYVRAIEELNPNAFVMENVKAMKSSKHKFFYSFKDHQEVVKELGLNLLPEKIIIGKTTGLTDELIGFLRESLQYARLSTYTINDKNLFSKISHISRKEKEAHVYLVKAEKALQKYLSTWREQHEAYWGKGYQEQWIRFGDLIKMKDHTESSKEILFKSLNEIIEIQKVLMRMNEIIANNIEITDIGHDHKNVYIEVKTYGVLDYLTSKFKRLGYTINEEHILNAAHFGAPQLRERLILIGVKKEFVGDNPVVLPESIFKDPSQFFTVEHAIKDLEDLEPFTLMEADHPITKPLSKNNKNPLLQYLSGNVEKVENHVMTETTQTALDRFKVLEPGQNFHHLDESYKGTYSDPGRTQNTVYLRLNYNTPSGTVLNVRKSMWIHPLKNRAISIREAARLQTFPDDFVFEGSKNSQYQQIGNAVPPLLGRAVAEQVLKYLGMPVKDTLKNIVVPQETVTII
ncbi:DNA cytosine methyltransferase [Paenibacillus contaminans]|uniref:DNA (cytosine-5-)-methyltransferase n=1 Tax=Paenibacillus contaminans TaxID=450362 RepID=A0A329MGL8_9BACL|nr:DNA cytosine methyltransferase [Paenibacillus contaminans]RAV17813.1 DNA cytosine methyltransferase [Paenibacillus contaminans]